MDSRRFLRYAREIRWGAGLETERRSLGVPFVTFYSIVFKQYFLRSIILSLQRSRGLFTSIQIETWGYCNRTCSFCFNSVRLPKREQGIMSEETFKRIVDQLGELDYQGRVSLHFYGEPLLDKRIPKLVEYARRACPDAFLHFSTNGDLLTEELLKTLIAIGSTHLTITDYEPKPQDRLRSLAAKYPIHAMLRHMDDFRKTNKAGMVLDYETVTERPCFRPTYQLVINWKGDVVLCCNDFYGQIVFGNVNSQTIMEIWNSDHFRAVREDLRQPCGRSDSPLCMNCDDAGLEP